jgi:hypothetical protein
MAFRATSTRYYHLTSGTELLNSEGTAISLASTGASYSSLYHKGGLIFSLSPLAGVTTDANLKTERWILKDSTVRITTVAASGDLQVLYSPTGSGASQLMTYSKAQLDAAGWGVATPQFLYWNPTNATQTPNATAGSTTTGYQIAVSLNGMPLTETTRASTGNSVYSYIDAIGGGTGTTYSDLCCYEYFVHTGAGLTATQLSILNNRRRGVGLQRMSFMPPSRLFYYLRCDAASYSTTTRAFSPVIGTGQASLYSITYSPNYATTSRLFLDGLSATTVPNRILKADRINRAGVTINTSTGFNSASSTAALQALLYLTTSGAGHDNFTLEMDVQPTKPLGVSVGQNDGSGTDHAGPGSFGAADSASIWPGNFRDLPANYEFAPYLIVGTDGVLFGLVTLYNSVTLPLLSWTGTNLLSSTTVQRLAIVVTDRTPRVYIDNVLKYTGLRTADIYSNGGNAGNTNLTPKAWPIRLYLQFAEPHYATYTNNRGGSFGGWLGNIALWTTDRTAYLTAAGSAQNFTGATTSTLALAWNCVRDEAGSSSIVDSSGNGRHGVLTNYDLTPSIISPKLRAGAFIL